jgi:hypothetical protein
VLIRVDSWFFLILGEKGTTNQHEIYEQRTTDYQPRTIKFKLPGGFSRLSAWYRCVTNRQGASASLPNQALAKADIRRTLNRPLNSFAATHALKRVFFNDSMIQ